MFYVYQFLIYNSCVYANLRIPRTILRCQPHRTGVPIGDQSHRILVGVLIKVKAKLYICEQVPKELIARKILETEGNPESQTLSLGQPSGFSIWSMGKKKKEECYAINVLLLAYILLGPLALIFHYIIAVPMQKNNSTLVLV